MSKRNFFIACFAIILWLTLAQLLVLLPSVEVAHNIQLFNTVELKQLSPEMMEYAANAKFHENVLWLKWFGFLALMLAGISGWMLYLVNASVSKWIVLVTSILYFLSRLASYTNYEHIV